jgi:hypothetical protein
MTTTTTTALPFAVRSRLDLVRQDLAQAPGSVSCVLDLAYELLHQSSMCTSDPSPLATQQNIAALIDCARLASVRLDHSLESLLEVLDTAVSQETGS